MLNTAFCNVFSAQIQKKQKKKIKDRIRKELRNPSAMTTEEEEAVKNIWTLVRPDRWKLYR